MPPDDRDDELLGHVRLAGSVVVLVLIAFVVIAGRDVSHLATLVGAFAALIGIRIGIRGIRNGNGK